MGSLLAKIGLPVLISAVMAGLKKLNHPVADRAADALNQVDESITAGQISIDKIEEANRHVEQMAAIQSADYRTALTQVNESLRREVASNDQYVRRMRPTFGYIMAMTWAAQMLSIAYTIIFDPERAGHVIHAMASLSTIWTVGLSVLGIYVYKRSQDKQFIQNPTQTNSHTNSAITDAVKNLSDIVRSNIVRSKD